MRGHLLAGVFAGLLVVSACGTSTSHSPPSPATTPGQSGPVSNAPALLTTPPPWPAPTSAVSALVTEAGLPLLPQEGLVEHIHAHLDVFYDGQHVTVPAYIGIDERAQGISPLHTHDPSGIVHIESTVVKPFYLGQFFTEWGVQTANGCVAGQCPPATPISVYINGSRVQTPPDKVAITAHAEIVVVVGNPPASIPSSYTFPSGY